MHTKNTHHIIPYKYKYPHELKYLGLLTDFNTSTCTYPPEFTVGLNHYECTSVIKLCIEHVFCVFFIPCSIIAGLSSALFVYFHRMFVLLRRKYRKHTMILERRSDTVNRQSLHFVNMHTTVFSLFIFYTHSIFLYPALVTMLITVLTFPLGLGQFMAGEVMYNCTCNYIAATHYVYFDSICHLLFPSLFGTVGNDIKFIFCLLLKDCSLI